MSITLAVNNKANVKQGAAADLLKNLSQPVINRYEATTTASQTTITLPYIVDTANTDAFFLFINGQKLRIGASYDFVFSSIDSSGGSSLITLTVPRAAGLYIEAFKMGLKKEIENLTDARFTNLYDGINAGFQGFVDESARLTAVNGAPSATQFRSTITGRASIPDLANDLKVRMGIDRIAIQSIFEIQNEFGPAGERVFGALNDDRGLIRFVGGGWGAYSGTEGPVPVASTASDFVEVTFFGTGFNVLTVALSPRDARLTVDGGTESATNIIPQGTSVLLGRNYSPNQVVPVVNGLALGIHTVKLRLVTSNFFFYGFEILTESSSINVRPGTAYQSGKKLSLSAASSVSYLTGFETVTRDGAAVAFSSTRGARVVEYLKSDGTKGKSAYLTNASQANLASADHTNEEVIRVIHPREFGAGRTDDFSTATSTAAPRAFTLDDGSTTLVSSNGALHNSGLPGDVLYTNGLNNFWTLTFIGTGLDILRADIGTGTLDNHAVTIDGVSAGTISGTASTTPRYQKIVSGLPYGTHTVRVQNTQNVNLQLGTMRFFVYQPKKPTLPAGAVELADYNVVADFVANTVQSIDTIATGVLRKSPMREHIFVGANWTTSLNTTLIGGWTMSTSGSSQYAEYTFFGTGFEYRFQETSGASTGTITVDGSTNLSGFTTSSYGGSVNLVAATGVFDQTNGATLQGSGIRVSGLTLGRHTVRFTSTSGSEFNIQALDIITPIHSPRSNFQADLQNTLPVGSQGIADNRKTSAIKEFLPAQKAWAQAIGITSGPSVASTSFVPLPDMSLTVKTGGGPLNISFLGTFANATAGRSLFIQIYVDGVAIDPTSQTEASLSGGFASVVLGQIVALGAGTHKVDVFWRGDSASFPWSGRGTGRILTVREF